MKVKKQFVVRKNMDVNEHERLYNITLGTALLLLFYISQLQYGLQQ